MTFRIAVGGIHTECSTSSPVLMRPEDFRVLRGSDLLSAEYFSFLPNPDVEPLPLLHARAVPGGPLARGTYEGFKAEFLDLLKASLPLDGLYLAMHGCTLSPLSGITGIIWEHAGICGKLLIDKGLRGSVSPGAARVFDSETAVKFA